MSKNPMISGLDQYTDLQKSLVEEIDNHKNLDVQVKKILYKEIEDATSIAKIAKLMYHTQLIEEVIKKYYTRREEISDEKYKQFEALLSFAPNDNKDTSRDKILSAWMKYIQNIKNVDDHFDDPKYLVEWVSIPKYIKYFETLVAQNKATLCAIGKSNPLVQSAHEHLGLIKNSPYEDFRINSTWDIRVIDDIITMNDKKIWKTSGCALIDSCYYINDWHAYFWDKDLGKYKDMNRLTHFHFKINWHVYFEGKDLGEYGEYNEKELQWTDWWYLICNWFLYFKDKNLGKAKNFNFFKRDYFWESLYCENNWQVYFEGIDLGESKNLSIISWNHCINDWKVYYKNEIIGQVKDVKDCKVLSDFHCVIDWKVYFGNELLEWINDTKDLDWEKVKILKGWYHIIDWQIYYKNKRLGKKQVYNQLDDQFLINDRQLYFEGENLGNIDEVKYLQHWYYQDANWNLCFKRKILGKIKNFSPMHNSNHYHLENNGRLLFQDKDLGEIKDDFHDLNWWYCRNNNILWHRWVAIALIFDSAS